MPNVTLGLYNTLAVAAASGVYRIKPGGMIGSYNVDLLNVGPGVVFLRADADPTVNDPASLQLPANMAFNDLAVNSAVGLGILAGADTVISVRVK